eukprot:7888074-Pyramimonas_sp.AAC.1
MKGKRFPELAAGELENVCNRHADSSRVHLSTRAAVAMTPDQWNQVQKDFVTAKAFIKAVFDIKFDWLKRLPWPLAALAHPDVR